MLRIVYAGSPAISVLPLKEIAEHHNVVAVLTNAPSPQGRSKLLVRTATALAATQLGIPVLEPFKLDESVREHITSLQPDILVCFAYSKIFGPKFLALYPKGGINIHPSLLPLYRGACPVPSAILHRETLTGITIQTLAKEMDSGDILRQISIPLTGAETSESLLQLVSMQSGSLVLNVLTQMENNTITRQVQQHEKATYCSMLRKEDGLIDWKKSALDIDAQIRAFCPWPNTYTTVNGQMLLIHKAKPYSPDEHTQESAVCTPCNAGYIIGVNKKEGILVQTGTGILSLQMLQWQAKKMLDWKTFLNGSQHFLNAQLGT